MSDPQDSRARARAKRDLGERLRQVRTELYGDHGGPELADLLGIPYRTWSNYESGVTIPGEVLLELLDLTGIEPRWLLRGAGAKFRPTLEERVRKPDTKGTDSKEEAMSGDGVTPSGPGLSLAQAE